MKGQRFLGVVLVCLFFLPAMALAQVTASVIGTVRDTSGAVIPGAAVTVKSLETGAARTVTTDERGYYRALSLPVGRYELTAEKTGFKREVRTGINLVVGQEAVLDLGLEVGEVQQAVTVTAEAPIVNTTTASTSGLVGEQQVKDLPLNGRSFDNLITLNPGTSNPSAMRSTGAMGPGMEFNISGRRGTDNLFLLNGIEYGGSALFGSTPGGASGQLLGIDAVREFNVQANTYGAQYGKRYGGQISVVTMSGTNQLHGTLFEFLRNDIFDAAGFFDNQAHAINGSRKPAFRRNDFGAAAGGPIRKDKTFIFGNYEGYRQRLTTTSTVFVPDAASRAAAVPAMQPYMQLWPTPPANAQELGGGIAKGYAPALNPVREDFGTLRLDHNFSEKNWMSGAYTIDDGSNLTPTVNPLSGTIVTQRNQVLSLDETHTFSPSVINTARVGFSRGNFYQDTHPLISLPASLSLVAGQPMGYMVVGSAAFGAAGALSSFGGITTFQTVIKNVFTYSDSVQITKGRHLLNIGASFQRLQLNDLFAGYGYGEAIFNDLPSLLQGKASTVVTPPSVGKHYNRQWQGAWYVDDTIKVLPNLTLTLGLRHEFTNGWNINPLGPANYVMGTSGCSAGAAQCIQTQPIVQTSMFTDNHAKWLFGPRVGLAWDPFGKGKTSIHAGYGTYYNIMDDMTYIIPQPSAIRLGSSAAPVQFPYQFVPGAAPAAGGVSTPFGLSPSDPRTPTLQSWNFTIEQQLTASTALSVGYVGSHGYHILGSGDVNPAVSVICPASPCPANIPSGTKYYPLNSPRLNPSLNAWGGFVSFASSSYNGLQVDLRQRLARGLTFRANYTYSKALDDGSVNVGGFFSNCPSGVMDAGTPLRDYGLACYDVTHRLSFNASYDLPIGQGKALLGGVGGTANKVIGGWKLNTIISAQNGLPFDPVVGFANSRNGGNGSNERPSLNPNFSGPVILGTPDKWFNPQAFILPPAGTYGNAGRNILRGPGLISFDMSLYKDTHITERVNVQFRAEFFNVINHPNFGEPAITTFTSSGSYVGSAGVISNTTTFPRNIQFGLKLMW